LNQTYDKWELLLIDDCSTDNSLKLINKYSDPRIRLFVNETNRGIAQASNRGIEESKGKYIALLDDDDEAIINRLELQVEYMEEHSDVAILGGRSIDMDEHDKILSLKGSVRNNPKLIKAMLLFGNVDFYNGTAMIRKNFIVDNQLRYRDGCYGMQDYRFYIESSKYGKITTLDQYLLKYREHENNETKRNLTEYAKKRAKKLADFQRESLEMSGFILKKEYMLIINKAFGEREHCDSIEELHLLYGALNEVLIQGNKMNIDYYDELDYLCKKKLGLQLLKMNIFKL
jgi:glycosyltransferase involved in cell wall biosynthesis